MLIQFSLKNYKVFKDQAYLSLVASNYDKVTRENENVSNNNNYGIRILKSTVVYGANASGKSKLIEAFDFVRFLVLNSSNSSQKGDDIDVDPFRLSSETENESSEFEIVFIYKDILYRYGFEVTKKEVISEWLFYKPKTKEIEVFQRINNQYVLHQRIFNKGRFVVNEGLVRDNALLITVAAQFNDEIAINVLEWFKRLVVLSGLHEKKYIDLTLSKSDKPTHKSKILAFLKAADLGISDLKLQKLEFNKLATEISDDIKDKLVQDLYEESKISISDVMTIHKKYNSEHKSIENVAFSLDMDESSGTNKFFALTGPILEVLENGYTLVVDELDSKLHPNLVCKLVELFNSTEFNPNQAQLIFNTHDTNLLNSGLFRRDQIYFTEKNKFGEARLYSLSDFKSDEVKKYEPFEENYLYGKYGAIPFLNTFKTD